MWEWLNGKESAMGSQTVRHDKQLSMQCRGGWEVPPTFRRQWCGKESESESRSVISNSLQPHGLYSSWNSPGQDTGVGSLSLLQGIFPTQESNPGLPHCRRILQVSYLILLRYQTSPFWFPKYFSKLWCLGQLEPHRYEFEF